MSIKSETSRMIDKIIATGPAVILKAGGYRKLGRSFHADVGGLIKVVQFQASMWNTPDSAQFTVNLNIVLPYFHKKWSGRPFPKNPASAAPVLTERIGHLMPEARDYWWKLTPKSGVKRIASHVTKSLADAGLPFLDRYADLQVLTKAMEQKVALRGMGINPDLCHVILLSFQGKVAEAAQVVQDLARENTHEGYANTIRTIAQRLELRVSI